MTRSRSLARLFQKATKAEKQVTLAYQEEIRCCRVGTTMQKSSKNMLGILEIMIVGLRINRLGLEYTMKYWVISQVLREKTCAEGGKYFRVVQ